MIADIPYLGPSRSQTLDLYEPADPSNGLRPAIVIIHGGGWRVGDKRDRRETQMAEVLTAAGFVCVSINYTMMSDGKPAWPMYLDDAREAVRFLRKHCQTYRIDPARIGAIGGSAGGNIALMLGLPADGDPPANVQAVVALYPPTDMAWAGKQRTALFGATGDELARIARSASPLYQVTADFPPTYLVHGTNDAIVSHEHSLLLAKRFEELGVTHQFQLIEGAPHTFKLHDEHADIREAVVAFFRTHLRHGSPTNSERK